MQNKITKCGDPVIFTDHSITEPIFTVHQEYNNYNNGNKGITDPTGFKEVTGMVRDSTPLKSDSQADVTAFNFFNFVFSLVNEQ